MLNQQAMEIRQQVAESALNDALKWLESSGDVAIFDATNVTLERRKLIHKRVVEDYNFSLLFLESICDNPLLIERNVTDVKIHGPDYENVDKDAAVDDFLRRIEHYEDLYLPLSDVHEPHLSYIKIMNAGEKLLISNTSGNLQSRIGYWLMNTHITPVS